MPEDNHGSKGRLRSEPGEDRGHAVVRKAPGGGLGEAAELQGGLGRPLKAVSGDVGEE